MVRCVLISEEEGNISEIETPLGSDMYKILKGTSTFIGQWPEIDVVIIKCGESPFELLDNRNILPRPFGAEHVTGPILLVRMDCYAVPQDFTLKEYQEFRRPRSQSMP
jgi:hypothetical protein